jgi:hypothetical protein
MEYSFAKTLAKVFKNLGVIMLLGALSAGVGAIGEVTAELGALAPLFALALQIGFTFAIDYVKHKPA